jgi:hypothetical protein
MSRRRYECLVALPAPPVDVVVPAFRGGLPEPVDRLPQIGQTDFNERANRLRAPTGRSRLDRRRQPASKPGSDIPAIGGSGEPVQMFAQVGRRYQIEWHHVMAAALLATAPVAVVFSFLQRYLTVACRREP